MEQNDITINNKIIADFMDVTVYPIKGTPEHKKWKGEACKYESFELKYNTSWDWLMPVVEKIEGLKRNFSIVTEGELTELYDRGKRLFHNIGHNRLESMYTTVVQFIQWYNKQHS